MKTEEIRQMGEDAIERLAQELETQPSEALTKYLRAMGSASLRRYSVSNAADSRPMPYGHAGRRIPYLAEDGPAHQEGCEGNRDSGAHGASEEDGGGDWAGRR